MSNAQGVPEASTIRWAGLFRSNCMGGVNAGPHEFLGTLAVSVIFFISVLLKRP